jgi:dTDP-4-dehydrorhamnose reductase
MKVLILGVSGMLGHALFTKLWAAGWDIYGTARDASRLLGWLPPESRGRLIGGVDALDFQSVKKTALDLRPEAMVNCVGLIRQKPEGREALPCIEVNARFPHVLLALARELGARLIHYSTDCVFDGQKGAPYGEDDFCSAKDVYGISKYLGEVTGPGSLTLRTSIIGHELFGQKNSLVEWFLSRQGQAAGYARAIYSGLPAVEQARILAEIILPRDDLSGLFQLSAEPISKHALLRLLAEEYGKSIRIVPDYSVADDKRLSGARFRQATGYEAPGWPRLLKDMREHHLTYGRFSKWPKH